jgi:hypothetical protein
VQAALADTERLDFHLAGDEVPAGWERLREEARAMFTTLNIWQADLVPVHTAST